MSQLTWHKLASIPPNIDCEKLFAVNDMECIIVGHNHNDNTVSVYKYNLKHNEWTKLFDEIWVSNDYPSFAFDKDNQVLYASSCEKWCSIDLKTKTIDTFSTNNKFLFDPPSISIVDKNIYFIDHEENKVYIFIKDTEKLQEISSFNTDSYHVISAFHLYVKSRKSLITTNYHNSDAGITSYISEFSILNNKWTRWEKTIESIFCSAIVATKGEQYLFFIGGTNSNPSWTDRILMYDVRNDTLNQISIKCPLKSRVAATITTRDGARDELLTFGFINRCYKEASMMPYCLIRLIANWICRENIHLIVTDGDSLGNHWCIDIDAIIQSAE